MVSWLLHQATNAEGVCAEIVLNQKPETRWSFNFIPSRFDER
jgi:hypothetical protein